jgi:2-(1,2-epoxy-1,2-dihydrophenyl)acetyl-CoA isomerase
MAYSTITFNKADNVATITLNRPDRSNAFDDVMITEFSDALKTLERDAEIRCIVITGAGKNFCAGQDLGAMKERYDQPGGVSFKAHLEGGYNKMVSRLRALEKPVIAAINGAAAGAGLGIACACDLRHASQNAKFRMAFIGIALSPDSGTSFHLPRLIGYGRALEMALTNELVDATRAYEMGLVNRLFAPEELLPKTMEFARTLAQAPTKSIGLTKRAFSRSAYVDLEAALEYEAQLQEFAGRSEDHREGVKAFLEKRPPVYKGA